MNNRDRMDLASGEWITDDVNNCIDCSQPKGINLNTGEVKCFTPICRASADLGAVTDGNDFLGEHFE